MYFRPYTTLEAREYSTSKRYRTNRCNWHNAKSNDTSTVSPPLSATPARCRAEVPMSAKKGLHRREISKALQQQKGWETTTRVGGDVLVRLAGSAPMPPGFSAEVRDAVIALGYVPEVSGFRDPAGVRWVRVKTRETSDESGQGAHD